MERQLRGLHSDQQAAGRRDGGPGLSLWNPKPIPNDKAIPTPTRPYLLRQGNTYPNKAISPNLCHIVQPHNDRGFKYMILVCPSYSNHHTSLLSFLPSFLSSSFPPSIDLVVLVFWLNLHWYTTLRSGWFDISDLKSKILSSNMQIK